MEWFSTSVSCLLYQFQKWTDEEVSKVTGTLPQSFKQSKFIYCFLFYLEYLDLQSYDRIFAWPLNLQDLWVFFLMITYTISRCPYQLCTKEMQILVFPKLFSPLPNPLFIPLLNSALYLEISPWAISQNSTRAFSYERNSFLIFLFILSSASISSSRTKRTLQKQ